MKKYPFLHWSLWLTLFCASFSSSSLLAHDWLDAVETKRFCYLETVSPRSLPGYFEHAVPYLKARGAKEDEIEKLVHSDLSHLSYALSLLFEQDPHAIFQEALKQYLFLINDRHPSVDHVGRELFGPLSFYLPLLKQISSQMQLVYKKDLVFSSTQIIKVLQRYDPTIKGVTIGRVYLHDKKSDRTACLELFQAAPMDNQNPQCFRATVERLSTLDDNAEESELTPIDHIAIELTSKEDVQEIHEKIHQLASETLRPNQGNVSYNPGDGSTQTKVLIRESIHKPFQRIVEFVHYEKKQD